MKLMGTTLVSVICIAIYGGVDGSKEGVQNRKGALFFTTLNCCFNGVNNAGLVFPSERPVFLREVNNNMYRVSAYFWAKVTSELP